MRCRKAFTLVEVLVVVAIIAMLVAILLPSLNRAREQARSAVCLANLRTLGVACHGYLLSERNKFCWGAVYPPNRALRPNEDPWGMVTYYFGGNSANGYPADKRPLNRYVQNTVHWGDKSDLRVYACPSDKGAREDDDATGKFGSKTAYVSYGTSYQSNQNWRFFSEKAEGAADTPEGSVRRFQLVNRIIYILERKGPSRALLLYEDGADWALTTADKLPDGFQVPTWHGRPNVHNVLFLDGRAESLYIDFTKNRTALPLSGTGRWVARHERTDN
jgi:prepilin-type N-terminal cleavage/methylation domain-containing protein